MASDVEYATDPETGITYIVGGEAGKRTYTEVKFDADGNVSPAGKGTYTTGQGYNPNVPLDQNNDPIQRNNDPPKPPKKDRYVKVGGLSFPVDPETDTSNWVPPDDNGDWGTDLTDDPNGYRYQPDITGKAPLYNPTYTPDNTATLDDIDSLAEHVKSLEIALQRLISSNPSGGGYRVPQRLMMSHSSQSAMVEAAMREGLNNNWWSADAINKGDSSVIDSIAEATGIRPQEVQNLLAGILGAGSSALTMVLSGGNFPLGAAAYYAGQGLTKMLMPMSKQTGQTQPKFEGIKGQGYIDGAGNQVTSLDVDIPLGLPHDIFGEYRFIVADRLSRPARWFPCDEVEPLQYWSNEPYRYIALDRVTSRVYHCNKVKAVRIYV